MLKKKQKNISTPPLNPLLQLLLLLLAFSFVRSFHFQIIIVIICKIIAYDAKTLQIMEVVLQQWALKEHKRLFTKFQN